MSALPRRWVETIELEIAGSRCRGQARSILLAREVRGAIAAMSGDPERLAVSVIIILM